MLTARQTLLHYLSLVGVFLSILQVFVFYLITVNIWISIISIFFSFLFIIVNILNVGKSHEIAKSIFVLVITSSLVIWSLYLPQHVEVSIYFIPLALIIMKLFDTNKLSKELVFSFFLCLLGMVLNFYFEGSFYKSSYLIINNEKLNHLSLSICFVLVFLITKSIIEDLRTEDKELFESKEKLMAIYNNLDDGIIFINRNFEIHWFNKKAEQEFTNTFNLNLKKGKKMDSFLTSDYLPKYKLGYDWALRGKISSSEQVFLEQKMSKVYYKYVYIPVFDKSNEIIGVTLQISNITNNRTIESELTQQKMMLEELYNQSPDALFLASCKSEKVIFYNNTAKDMFGFDEDSNFISYKQLFNKNDDPLFWIKMDKKLTESDFEVFEATNRRENNELFIGETRIKKFSINRILHLLIRISDISDKVAQRELKFSMLEMERKNAENLLSQKNLGMMIQGQEEERQRISKDLHDGIGQMLTAIRLEVTSLESLAKEDIAFETKTAKAMIDNTIQEVKRISNNLMPSAIVDLGLIPALKSLLLLPNKEIKVNFEYEEFVDKIGLSKKQEITIYRIIQESLNNALKYANPTELNVFVQFLDVNNLLIRFADNGTGFDINETSKKLSSGLINMKERASIIDAKLKIISQINSGTTIEMIIRRNGQN